MGKSLQEGLGEVQEMIDICDFAVGLSRQLHGLTMHSERPAHRMYEQYHPLGIVGVISAFNFPWRYGAGTVCWPGYVVMYVYGNRLKSSSVCRCLPAYHCRCFCKIMFPREWAISSSVAVKWVNGWRLTIAFHWYLPLVSPGWVKQWSAAVGARLGRALLELGGNNAIIISKEADQDIAILGSLFGAVGTAGQRCTTTRSSLFMKSIWFSKKPNW